MNKENRIKVISIALAEIEACGTHIIKDEIEVEWRNRAHLYQDEANVLFNKLKLENFKNSQDQVELLNKQYDELQDRFDVAMKALELLITPPINYSNTKDVANRAITKINQMIKDCDSGN